MVVLPINYVFYSNYKYNTNYVFKNNINKPKLHKTQRPWHKRSFCTTTSIIDRNLLFHNPFSLSKYPNNIINAGPLISPHGTSESIIEGNFYRF